MCFKIKNGKITLISMDYWVNQTFRIWTNYEIGQGQIYRIELFFLLRLIFTNKRWFIDKFKTRLIIANYLPLLNCPAVNTANLRHPCRG